MYKKNLNYKMHVDKSVLYVFHGVIYNASRIHHDSQLLLGPNWKDKRNTKECIDYSRNMILF